MTWIKEYIKNLKLDIQTIENWERKTGLLDCCDNKELETLKEIVNDLETNLKRNSKMKKLIIDISECDIDDFKSVVYNDSSFTWLFDTTDGEPIEIQFIATPDDTDNIEPYDDEFDR